MLYSKNVFHRSVLIGLVILLALVTHASAEDKPLAIRPNILLVVADDMGYTDIGSFGGEIQTPHLDALAGEGVRFSNFHTSVSCSPTRSMLMTGTDNHIAGLGNMAELMTPEQKGKPGYEGHLNDRVVTLAEVLRAGGYHTYLAGKWHLGEEPEQLPYARGFERAFGIMAGGSHWHDMTGIQAVTPVAAYALDDKMLDELPRDFYSSKNYAEFVINAIRKNRGDGKPFLAYLAFQAPHDPIHVPEPWLSKYRGKYDDGYEALKARRIAGAKHKGIVAKNAPAPVLNPNAKPWDSLSSEKQAWESRAMEAYAGMVENMDYHIGRVITFLKDIGEYDNTLIIFTSDNGPNPWYSEEYPSNPGSEFIKQFDNSIENIGRPGSNVAYGPGWASASAGPLDYFKLTVGEGGVRTPMIVVGPGIKGERQVDSFAYVTDIMPTILELAQLEHPAKYQGREVEPMRGRSLTGVLFGSQEHTYLMNALIGAEMSHGKWMCQGDYKAVLVAKPFGPGEWRLYNTAKDPGETADLSTEHPEILEELVTAWGRYAKDVGVVSSK
jgi:arylsulfatase A-like enzyme